MHLLSVTFNCLAILTIVALGFLVVNFARYMKKQSVIRFSTGNSEARFPVKSAVVFLGAALLTLLVALSVTSVSRREVLEFITDAQALKVYVNSQPAPNSDEIVAALKILQPVAAHHSHPTKMIKIELHSETAWSQVNAAATLRFPTSTGSFIPSTASPLIMRSAE